MNFQFEPLKKFFTPNPINNEVAVLRAQVRALQNILSEEEEKKLRYYLFISTFFCIFVM